MNMERRRFLQAGALAGALVGLPAARSAPLAGPRYRLSLAAYSMRKFLDLKNGTMDLAKFLDHCAEWGWEGAELTEYFFKKPLSADEVMALKRRAIKLGLDITGTPIGNTFTHPPGEARDREVAKMKAWIDVSADLGSPAIRIFAGNTPKGGDEAQARGWVVECIQACLDHAAKRGVILALENHGGVVAKAEGILDIASKVKSDWFGVNLDTGNFHVDDPYAELEKVAHLAVTCQVKAEMSVGGKRQAADYARLVEMMRKVGYRGYITLEYESAEDPMQAIPKHLEALRKAVG
jgi:sugar phosphate isomerase/epimerase